MSENKAVSISFSRSAGSDGVSVGLNGSAGDLLLGLSFIVHSMRDQGVLDESAFMAVWLASFGIGPDSVSG